VAEELRLADPRFDTDAVDAVAAVLRSGRLTQGPLVEAFEEAIAAYCGVPHAIATTSATSALHLTLAALDIGPRDEVIVPDFTFPATGNVVLQQRATLRLADVDPVAYTLDPEQLAATIGPRTRAVVAVDLFGLPADYAAIEPILERHGVPLVCDAACSLGATSGDRRCGAIGAAGCFSFHPRKLLTTGEGGMVTTADAALARRLRRLRNHGVERDGWRSRFLEVGFNYRLPEIPAALGLVQVPKLPAIIDARRTLAAQLTELVSSVEGVVPPFVPAGRTSSFQSYVVRLDGIDRDSVIARLRARGIEATLGTYALHAEPAFARVCDTRPGDRPSSYRATNETLALPLHQGMRRQDLERIAGSLAEAVRQGAPVS
jgi:perosamine synthetase